MEKADRPVEEQEIEPPVERGDDVGFLSLDAAHHGQGHLVGRRRTNRPAEAAGFQGFELVLVVKLRGVGVGREDEGDVDAVGL